MKDENSNKITILTAGLIIMTALFCCSIAIISSESDDMAKLQKQYEVQKAKHDYLQSQISDGLCLPRLYDLEA